MSKKIEENQEITKTVKAITGQENIKLEEVNLDDNFFAQNQNLVNKNHFSIPKTGDFKTLRALSDLASCYFLFHDREIHNQVKSQDNFNDFEQKLIDDFEKIRVIGCVKNQYFGVSQNNLNKIAKDIDFSLVDSDANNLQILLLEAIFQNHGKNPLPPKITESLNLIKQHFKPKPIAKIQELAKYYQSQEEFSQKTLEFLDLLKDENENKTEQEKTKDEPQEKQENQSQNQENIEQNSLNQGDEEEEKPQKPNEEKPQKSESQNALESLQDKIQANAKTIAGNNFNEEKLEFKKLYKFFTSKFDEIILPQKLVNKSELEILRINLDSKIEKLEKISKRLTLKLKQKLLSKQNITIEKSESEGLLDRKKLTQLILNPFEDNFFIKQKNHDYQNTVVTILLDNSGSMRGNPIVMSALACEIIAEILEKFSIKTEILGFTTADWRGGKSRKMWERQEKPKSPGRLNDLRHIIYKSANQKFKKAKVNLALMLKEGFLKENIDGEALLWAKSRLMQSQENRKILMVISDGTPVDDSTNSTNDKEILIDHLHQVIKNIEKQNKIELVGIGIGHNVGELYQNAISIKNLNDLGDVMIEKLVDLL